VKGKKLEVQNLARICNEAVLLSVLCQGPMHGYQIALKGAELPGGYFSFKYGTLYPILHSLEKRGMIQGLWHGKKKAYTITSEGRKHRDALLVSWRDFSLVFNSIAEGVCDAGNA